MQLQKFGGSGGFAGQEGAGGLVEDKESFDQVQTAVDFEGEYRQGKFLEFVQNYKRSAGGQESGYCIIEVEIYIFGGAAGGEDQCFFGKWIF